MNTFKPKPNRRGQANVEMALVMLALVPTFLYVLTTDDLMRYRLNLQEVVVSSPWDYTHLDYEPREVQGNALVGKLQRTYQDVNMGYSAEAVAASSSDKTAPMTFAAWNLPGSQQVDCSKEANDIAAALTNSSFPAGNLGPQVNHGGLYTCNAALAVRNEQLISRYMQDFAGDTLLSDTAPSSAWNLNRQHFSVLSGTWAMTEIKDVKPGDRDGFLYERVDKVYTGATPTYHLAFARAWQFVLSDASDILSPLVATDFIGDDTRTLEVGFSKKARPSVQFSNNERYDASPWRTRGAGGNTHEQAYTRRKNTYLGRELKN